LLDDRGRITGLTIAALDITARKAAEERQRLLTAELDHRVRNTLAAIQSLVTLSARSGQSKEDYTLALQGRIDAYTRIYGFLAAMQWQCVNLHQLTSGVTRTFGNSIASRFHVDGDNLLLNPSAAISLNLIFHELATNAVRYGAASVAQGRISLTWDIRDDHFVLTWREMDGPAITAQVRPGFGSRLIRQLLAKDLRATFQLEYPAEGALLTASIPLKRLEVDKHAGDFLDTRARMPGQATPDAPLDGLAKARVLLVEDDPLIGLEFQTALADAGVEAVGPMPDLHHSLTAIMNEGGRFDAAILDVNLRGESTLPLAQLLSERGVPYMFVSGYDLDAALPVELRHAPKLQKPVTGSQLLAAVRSLIGTRATRDEASAGERS
jgi:two-component sensor histidine kinase/CheY-like chemotaxis protein